MSRLRDYGPDLTALRPRRYRKTEAFASNVDYDIGGSCSRVKRRPGHFG